MAERLLESELMGLQERNHSIDVQLIPLEQFAEPRFDLSQLPFPITPGITAEDVSEMMPPSEFVYMEPEVGKHQNRFFNSTVKFGLVHRYVPSDDDGAEPVLRRPIETTALTGDYHWPL